jgi:uncharacterized protein (DUF2236 family)
MYICSVLQLEAHVVEYRKSIERCDVLDAALHSERQKRYMQEMATLYTDIDIFVNCNWVVTQWQ